MWFRKNNSDVLKMKKLIKDLNNYEYYCISINYFNDEYTRFNKDTDDMEQFWFNSVEFHKLLKHNITFDSRRDQYDYQEEIFTYVLSNREKNSTYQVEHIMYLIGYGRDIYHHLKSRLEHEKIKDMENYNDFKRQNSIIPKLEYEIDMIESIIEKVKTKYCDIYS